MLGLARTCHLFSYCSRTRDCSGCTSGPRDCEARCQVPPVRGGRWYCDGSNSSLVSEARSLDSCYYLCEANKLQRLTCLSGKWDEDPVINQERFTCRVNRDGSCNIVHLTFILCTIGST